MRVRLAAVAGVPVFINRQNVPSPGIDFHTATSDLAIPGFRVWLRFRVKTVNRFEREAGALFGAKTKNLGEHVAAGDIGSL
jgi:hypothetical protein